MTQLWIQLVTKTIAIIAFLRSI